MDITKSITSSFERIVTKLSNNFTDKNSPFDFSYKTKIDFSALQNQTDANSIPEDSFNENLIVKFIEKLIINLVLHRFKNQTTNNICLILKEFEKNMDNYENDCLESIKKSIDEFVDATFFHVFTANDINLLSLKNLESKPCSGTIAIFNEKIEKTLNKKIKLSIKFDSRNNKFSINKNDNTFKYLRKMISLTDGQKKDLVLVVKKRKTDFIVMGLSTMEQIKSLCLPYFKINGKMDWKINAYGEKLSFSKGEYIINPEHSTEELVDLLYKKIEIKIDSDVTINLIDKIIENAHGALLIFIEDISHINELCKLNRGIKIVDSKYIKKDNIFEIANLCGIDGALIISSSGQICSIGTILDGCASSKGDLARGSRFNSSLTFIDSCKENEINACAIVISEDGYINIIAPSASNKTTSIN